jgi:regulatory protein
MRGRARTAGEARPRRSALGEAAALLARRSRTESELRSALDGHHEPAAVDAAVERLSSLGYLNDAALTRHYVEGRRASGRGAMVLRRELAARGVDADLTESALDGRDEHEAARAAARPRLRSLARLDRERRYRRLAGFLARRGFASDVVASTLHELLDGEPEAEPTEETASRR